MIAKDHWVRSVQRGTPENMERQGWKLIKEKTGILKCVARISGYNPTYLESGSFARKLILHVQTQVKHLGVANTMAALREEWWIRILLSERRLRRFSKHFPTLDREVTRTNSRKRRVYLFEPLLHTHKIGTALQNPGTVSILGNAKHTSREEWMLGTGA